MNRNDSFEFRHTITTFTQFAQNNQKQKLIPFILFAIFLSLILFSLLQAAQNFALAPLLSLISDITVFFHSVHIKSHITWAGIFTILLVFHVIRASLQCIYLVERTAERELQP